MSSREDIGVLCAGLHQVNLCLKVEVSHLCKEQSWKGDALLKYEVILLLFKKLSRPLSE